MKNNGFFKTAATLLAALVLLGGFSVTAYADGGDYYDYEDEYSEEVTGGMEPQPLTPDGNLSLIDDIEGEAAEDKQFIAALRDGLIEAEARRIVADMKRQYSPNSPNKTHYMTELAPAFMMIASSRDVDRLFSLLPYKTLTFSKIEGRHGIYALIDKNENRDRDIRKPRPSIREQLAADKKKAAPKRAAKTKNHEMEV